MKKVIDETELTPRQKKQLEKLERRKKYADVAIQGTNTSSIASKRSAELLFVPKLDMNRDVNRDLPNRQYFKYFVPKAPKRSPCMNRGYWLRLHGIRTRLQSILEENANFKKEILVINLGCGFDPLPFQLLDESNLDSIAFNKAFDFLDIDYADLIRNKIRMIEAEPELLKIVGDYKTNIETKSKSPSFISEHYTALSCNLNDAAAYLDILKSNEKIADPNVIKIFIAEVSLAYMKPEYSDEIISLTSKHSPHSHFITIEQLMQEGENEPFSKQMVKHFKKNDSPLQSIMTYHTIQGQIDRFNSLGYSKVNAGSIAQLWESVSPKLQKQIDDIELFDELEEFHLVSQHYLLLHATNIEHFEFIEPYKFTAPPAIPAMTCCDATVKSLDTNINRRFGSAVASDKKVGFYFGGANPSRLQESIEVSLDDECNFGTVQGQINVPSPRMCHTLNKINDDQYVLVGGRTAPGQGFDEVYTYRVSTKTWELKEKLRLPEPRYRHCTVNISSTTLLVFGGKSTSSAEFLTLDIQSEAVTPCAITYSAEAAGYHLESLASASMTYDEGTTAVPSSVARTTRQNTVSDKLVTFEVVNGNTVHIKSVVSSSLFQRYGSKTCALDDDEILLVGGTSNARLFNQRTSIVKYNLHTQELASVPISDETWVSKPLCLIGFELLHSKQERRVYILGGGTTCYGFGSITNANMAIDY
ncbi:hypothetical protein TPHA_0P01530 [Tetrapisispora phaffii CBS 4417]|uniref:tRNA wybutosine-synthesizing protein 4 n=1 Tax=Tetrapisispora phaffii (strain ATCC 24235 / CBS 4417 / NBRC 1672 / NRRL Y-8282 / UCD 70-5) TaxID=1071381 RepID=G8C2D3_TETPH|nr:hypothetical protein TPHA_0P01530 [Tetrapisispora phaffii CBS 4417]CCE66311.1 hypothetical protein TPHA_0P01530 [Tetrapisispora phaffii CBS 4417]